MQEQKSQHEFRSDFSRQTFNGSLVEEDLVLNPAQLKPSTGEATNIDFEPIKVILRSPEATRIS
jgi:hypothetical protein